MNKFAAMFAFAGLPAFGTSAFAQSTTTPPVPGPETPIVELSPFTVNTERDTGYFADSTLAGSRLNTRLRDTPSSISVFTEQFLEDLAVNDISELMNYTVNSEMDTINNTTDHRAGALMRAGQPVALVRTRGLAASQGLDFFTSITPVDAYRLGRYEDSRGPNSILYGIGSPGGLINQSSKTANTRKDALTLRYSTGNWGRGRAEVHANKAIIRDKLALAVSAVDQDNGGWRNDTFHDKQMLYGTITFTPHRRLTFRAMGEIAHDDRSLVAPFTPVEQVLAWYDNREALGVDAVTFNPTNANPNASMIAVGVTGRNANFAPAVRRITWIENDGTVFNAAGTLVTGTYNIAGVRAPDGTPGNPGGGAYRLNEPAIAPLPIQFGGPGTRREQDSHNFTLTGDWQIARNLFLNVAHNYQKTEAFATAVIGNGPILEGDPNRLLGVNGPANPYAGRMYVSGNYEHSTIESSYRETRVTLSYDLDTKSRWFGRHRIAALWSTSDLEEYRNNGWLVLRGRPFNSIPSAVNNRLTLRHYVTEGDHRTFRVPDWRTIPSSVTVGGQSYEVVWANNPANNNTTGAGKQSQDTYLGVLQSTFGDGRLVTTLGWRRDDALNQEYGYLSDPDFGDIPDPDPAKRTLNPFRGTTKTVGAVFHATPWLSLVANRATNIDIPRNGLAILPDGQPPGSPEGRGYDLGLSFDLFDNRLNAKVVYFKTQELGTPQSLGVPGNVGTRNLRVMDAFASVLVGPGLPISQAQWDPLYQQYTPRATVTESDFDSEGYELRLTANLTRNWRLVMNFSETDAIRTNILKEVIRWYGMKVTEGGDRVEVGASQNSLGQFVVDPSAFEPGGTVARWTEFASLHPDAALDTLTTSADSSVTIAEEIYNLTTWVNDNKEQQEKRWGLRPYRFNVFTAYDFNEGRLRGLTIGGGWRWQSKNIVGERLDGSEIKGKAVVANDFMMRYTLPNPVLRGRLVFQLNVNNVFDQTGIIPQRIAATEDNPEGYEIPGGRGIGYRRFDLIAPREIRFTTTYSF